MRAWCFLWLWACVGGHLIVPRDLDRPDRIVGGEPVAKGDFQWQVSLQFYFPGGRGTHFCGASLIAPAWILTAAHCMRTVDVQQIVAVTGAWDLTEENSMFRILKIFPGKFDATTMSNDIALVKLDLQHPLRIITRDLGNPVPIEVGKKHESVQGECSVSGFGRMSSGGSSSTVLRAASVNVLLDEDCTVAVSRFTKFPVHNSNLCAGGGERDACQGDSGGPLVCCSKSVREASSCRLQGITSWGIGCATLGMPGIYTEVAYYRKWIKETVEKEDGSEGLRSLLGFEEEELDEEAHKDVIGDTETNVQGKKNVS